ncbi:hypothetical protein DL546_003851 [Coniochaeta pulveracea]|nr:hypothetical protein DL546_003851 [Coniochaeta pulveracea]
MSSDIRNSLALRRGSFLLLQEEPVSTPLAAKGHGTLTSLIRNRSASSLHALSRVSSVREPRDEEEWAGSATTDWVYRPEGDDASSRSLNERRMSAILNTPQMRSMRLIGNSNPRYRWEQYWKTPEQLASMKKKVRQYYERTNYLIQQYLYIDRLLDSSLPHDLLNEYNMMPTSSFRGVEIPHTITEESSRNGLPSGSGEDGGERTPVDDDDKPVRRVRRTPKDIYRATEATPLLHREETPEMDGQADSDGGGRPRPEIPLLEDDEVDSSERIVTVAIYVNMVANAVLLAGKIAVIVTVPSVSVLASLVDALLDFLSTGIVWTTTWLIAQQDQYRYPIGRRRLEPLGVLVFSVIMITSFVQVALQAIQTLAGTDHTVVELGIPAIAIMLGTIGIKGVVWLWYRMVKNSSVRAL